MYICQDVCRNTYTENMTLLFSVKMLGARDGQTIDVIFIVSLEEYFVSFILHMAPLYMYIGGCCGLHASIACIVCSMGDRTEGW